jgi:hypothetical protein
MAETVVKYLLKRPEVPHSLSRTLSILPAISLMMLRKLLKKMILKDAPSAQLM